MQLLICLLFLRGASTVHLDSLGRPVLAQRLLQPRFQANPPPETVGTEEETCLSLYAFYKAKCPQDHTACPGRDCASALDSFKCCLKQSHAGAGEIQQGGVAANVTRWEALGLTAVWLNIRRALITRAEVCQKHGFESFSPCPIPDFPPVKVDSSTSQALYQTQMQKELLSALAETQAQERRIRRDIDDFGLSDQIQALTELTEREAVLRSQLST